MTLMGHLLPPSATCQTYWTEPPFGPKAGAKEGWLAQEGEEATADESHREKKDRGKLGVIKESLEEARGGPGGEKRHLSPVGTEGWIPLGEEG